MKIPILVNFAEKLSYNSKNIIIYDCEITNWSVVNFTKKAKRRVAPRSGRCRHLKNVGRRAKNGFRDGQKRKTKE